VKWIFDRVLGIGETRICECRTCDQVSPDFPNEVKGDRRRSILWVRQSPDKGFEEHSSSSGLGRRKILVGADVARWRVCTKWYQSED
jgi:hypothetical protein